MWKPKQLLCPEVIESLTQADFSPERIEFLGWLSWIASALNNSRNPVKAAHTMLAKPTVVPMVEKFLVKKQQSVQPTVGVPDHEEADALFRTFNQWKQANIQEPEVDEYAPETE